MNNSEERKSYILTDVYGIFRCIINKEENISSTRILKFDNSITQLNLRPHGKMCIDGKIRRNTHIIH
ncbi:MAG: hypothetical protein LBG48_03285 [Rickettsiales bacterium]|nr:hypothetical protein [Rickettsiales bacterium]